MPGHIPAVLVSLLVAAGLASGPALAASAAEVPAAPTAETLGLTCDSMFTAEQAASFTEAGYQRFGPSEDAEPSVFTEPGGVFCRWAVPQSDVLYDYGYAPVTPAASEALVLKVTDPSNLFPMQRFDVAEGALYTSSLEFGETAFLFADGAVYLAPGYQGAVELRDLVLRLAAAAVPSPTPQPEEETALDTEPSETVLDEEIEIARPPRTIDTPSVLSTLPAIGDKDLRLERVVAVVLLTLVLILVVALPSALLSSAVEEHYDRLAAVVAPLRRPFVALRARQGAPTGAPVPGWIPIAVGVVSAALIACFLDPALSFDESSARQFVSTLGGIVVESVLGLTLVAVVLRSRRPDLEPRLQFQAGSLVVVLIAVVLSRLLGFEPGVLFGLVLGLAFAVPPATADTVLVTWLRTGWIFLAGLIGWAGYSIVGLVWAGDPNWPSLLLGEAFGALAIGGIAALPLMLLPVPGLDGSVLFRSSKVGWAAAWGVSVLVFFFVLLPLPASWDKVGAPLVGWVSLLIAYAVAAVAVWAILRFTARERNDAGSGPSDPEAVSRTY
ncbi:hypothetical protein ACFSBZ_06025 [Amnibacterium flavum]|uniref:Uncharacterized protein n=1 Tax=Amnibacterium flavum TaxID=2173173 RepID=A0A2V1HUJ8_9MICO|nr:hypothetical protein [Amnibacterium flavum]PVZ93977.1 hypothetical protein DDQ50_09460 [Amnibacterium flavum]